ncbi:sensor histidine kinase [Dyadobacter arcticus]|uniref:histidine kinase n=1 Tax=Dyadobacter arcticus TaxID=1078754 RepID=A0ABX0UIJ4_9BACT|nr:ATP-binding protein [Dyadobacter arcticus]NIJ52838.1 signal transduction histidine kinase [Dyadobacter arcticus]
MKFKLLLVFVLFAHFCFAQSATFPDPFLIKTDTISKRLFIPGKYYQYLPDPGEKLTLREVVSPQYSTRFAFYDTTSKGVSDVLWLRYRIKNEVNKPVNVLIPEGVDRADVYIQGVKKHFEHFTTGAKVPWDKQDGIRELRSIAYEIPANTEITVYERNDLGNTLTPLGIGLSFREKALERYLSTAEAIRINSIFYSAFVGFLFFSALINLFFYSVVKEPVYLFYFVVNVFSSANFAADELNLLFFRYHPGYFDFFEGITRVIANFALYHAMRHFLRISQQYPRWNKVIIWTSFVYLLTELAYLFVMDSATYAVRYAFYIAVGVPQILLMGGICITLIIGVIKNRGVSRIFAIGALPFVLIWLVNVLFQTHYPEISTFANNLFIPALVWTVVVNCWILFGRFRDLLNENAQQVLEKERLEHEKETQRLELLAQQKVFLEQQVAERTAELSQSLDHLKTTQNQLIQAEKMASLGELTAGIAHEIQNPLNFVNNFSEVSVELIAELKEELSAGRLEDVAAIADDLDQNMGKINHHGKRADNIVKGMLQHSQSSSSEKEPTDINALADEYFKLSYHGLRAKDTNFNAELITHFDQSLPKVNAIPQDLGRVLLNMINNAFYSVNQKSKTAGSEYKSRVEVSTRQTDSEVHISVKDNGIGIPASIKEKILQPFFTTKPTGEGTGLGLSLSYDIITKAHGGNLRIDSIEGEGAEFVISLPVTQ